MTIEEQIAWRDTQRQIDDNARAIAALAADRLLGERLQTLGERTDARIATLVTAIGDYIRQKESNS
jgi:hypothetical protein